VHNEKGHGLGTGQKKMPVGSAGKSMPVVDLPDRAQNSNGTASRKNSGGAYRKQKNGKKKKKDKQERGIHKILKVVTEPKAGYWVTKMQDSRSTKKEWPEKKKCLQDRVARRGISKGFGSERRSQQPWIKIANQRDLFCPKGEVTVRKRPNGEEKGIWKAKKMKPAARFQKKSKKKGSK